jgi:olefin beta-lactone synthetase
MNLVTLLIEKAGAHPDRPALVDRLAGHDRVVTYGELARRVSAGAAALEGMGLQRGQVVLVFQPVSIELYEILLAAFHAGLRVMLADPSGGREFLSACCRRLAPDVYFGSWKAQLLRLSVPEMRRIPLAFSSGRWFPGARVWRTDAEEMPPVAVADGEAALVTFTSGSTGAPKAAVRSHGFLLAQHRALSKSLEFEDSEVDLITLPVFVLANLASGLTSVLAATDLARPGSPDVAAVSAQCREFNVTRCAASPAFFEGLLRSPTGLPSIAKIYTGGAPVFPDLLSRLSEALPDARVVSVYGSTEAEPIAHFSAGEADESTAARTRQGGGLCSGLPVPEIDLRILPDQWGTPLGPLSSGEFSQMALGTDQVGEIVVSGEHVLSAYLGGIGDEETKIHVGGRVWHRTGDAGCLDAAGRVWLLGRCAEKLPDRGGPVYPFAIECALRESFPGVRTAAIHWENQRTLVFGQQCDSAEIRKLAEALGMEQLVFLDSLPMDRRHQAKIDYPKLREILKARP